MSKLNTKSEPRVFVERALPETAQLVDSTPVLPVKSPSVLGIGLPRGFVLEGVDLRRPANDRAVIELLRQTEFDLLLVSTSAEDDRVWNLMALVRRHWPGLRWALLAEQCSDALEIKARSLGAICVTADQKTIEELAFS